MRIGVVALALLSAPLAAQVAPDLHWETINTAHFHVHFSPGVEQTARRAAGSAERAYTRLSKELHEPRGPIDIVVADNEDISNGYTTTFPTNRIVIYARPTVDANSLHFLDDWIDLVVTHELAHVFHLDRSKGWWRAAQYVFGRNPFLFPNQYTPSWLDEGIAVYYESRLTGSGRIEGTDHATTARAQAMDNLTPRLNALSASTLVYPLGDIAYVYGSLLIEEIARSQGNEKMREFVDLSASRTIPFLLNANAKASFGISFDSAWHRLTDSVHRNALMAHAMGPANARVLTPRGWITERLRWTDDTHIVYGSNDGKSISELREVSTAGGKPKNLGRRNTIDITSPIGNKERVYSQMDFTDPYTLRADLYLEKDGQTTRLTNGARLMQPDARWRMSCLMEDAPVAVIPIPRQLEVVAVQLVPGASRLVRIELGQWVPNTCTLRDTVTTVPLTSATYDTVWSEPRWSHDGARIAATRWIKDGYSEIAILDRDGHFIQSIGRVRAVVGTPSWAKGDTAIYFASDRTGRSMLYRASLPSGQLHMIAAAATGLFEAEQSPDGSQIATLLYRGDGYHIAVIPTSRNETQADSQSVLNPSRRDPTVTSDAPAKPYTAWRSLLPRYWLPAAEQSDNGATSWGFITGGRDVLSRHAYDLQVTFEPQRHEPSGSFDYSFAGFGNPVVGVSALQEWDRYSNIRNKDTVVIGTVRRSRTFVDAALTYLHPRVTTSWSLSVGGELEFDDYRTDPADLLNKLTPDSRARLAQTNYPSIFVSAGWANARRPILGLSAEDGIQLSFTARQRWNSDFASETRSNSIVGTAIALKSLDLPGNSHHVIALKASAAFADDKSTSTFSAGGVSGQQLSIVPGVTIGEGHRTFPVRGFPSGAEQGIDALGGSGEYRFPISIPSKGLGMLPLFLQRLSGVAFVDAATAWCPANFNFNPSSICPQSGIPRDWMSSAGAELQLDAAYDYDSPYRFRLGIATPISGRKYFGQNNAAVYFSLGLSF